MALITCVDCDRQFSSEASQCPNCGRPNVPLSRILEADKASASRKQLAMGCAGLAVIFIVVAAIQGVGGPTASDAPISSPPAASRRMEDNLALIDGRSGEAYRYTPLLDALDSRCVESRDNIGDMATKAGQIIKEKTGREESIESLLQAWDRGTSSLSPPDANCAGVMAAMLVLMTK
jgi:hypothetical protein